MKKRIWKKIGPIQFEDRINRLVRVEVDCRDARFDRYVPEEIVKAKLATNELFWNMTNRMPCVPNNGICPTWLMSYKLHG